MLMKGRQLGSRKVLQIRVEAAIDLIREELNRDLMILDLGVDIGAVEGAAAQALERLSNVLVLLIELGRNRAPGILGNRGELVIRLAVILDHAAREGFHAVVTRLPG